MVGHTHEDVDQLFSRISSGLAKRDAHTLPQLLEAIEKSATEEVDIVPVQHITSITREKEESRPKLSSKKFEKKKLKRSAQK